MPTFNFSTFFFFLFVFFSNIHSVSFRVFLFLLWPERQGAREYSECHKSFINCNMCYVNFMFNIDVSFLFFPSSCIRKRPSKLTDLLTYLLHWVVGVKICAPKKNCINNNTGSDDDNSDSKIATRTSLSFEIIYTFLVVNR